MLEIFIDWLIPAICGAVLTGCITYVKMRNKRNSALEDGVQCLLRAEIIRNHDKYVMEKKFCPIYAKEALKRVYTAYHSLGGNDVATRLYDATMELPTEAKNDE